MTMLRRILNWFCKTEEKPFDYDLARQHNIDLLLAQKDCDLDVKMIFVEPKPKKEKRKFTKDDLLIFKRNIDLYSQLMTQTA